MDYHSMLARAPMCQKSTTKSTHKVLPNAILWISRVQNGVGSTKSASFESEVSLDDVAFPVSLTTLSFLVHSSFLTRPAARCFVEFQVIPNSFRFRALFGNLHFSMPSSVLYVNGVLSTNTGRAKRKHLTSPFVTGLLAQGAAPEQKV